MSTELLERRANHGTARGAAHVWANAQAAIPAPEPSRPWVFRLALVTLALALGFITLRVADNALETADAGPDDDLTAISEPLPNPYLIDGLQLDTVIRPVDPAFDADELFGVASPALSRTFEFRPEFNSEIAVYAERADAFEGPVFIIAVEGDGTTSTASANIFDSATVETYESQINFEDDLWTLEAASGLVEVARFQSESTTRLGQGWDFFFLLPPDENQLRSDVLLSALPSNEAREWSAIASLALGSIQTSVTTVELESIDETGVRIRHTEVEDDFGEVVVWDTDGYQYTIHNGNLEVGLENIQLSDTQTWVSTVQNADFIGRELGSPFGETAAEFAVAALIIVFLLLIPVIFVGSFLWANIKRNRSERDEEIPPPSSQPEVSS